MKKNGKTSPAELRAVIALCVLIFIAIGFPWIRNTLFPRKTVIADLSVTEEYLRREQERRQQYETRRWENRPNQSSEKWSRPEWKPKEHVKNPYPRDSFERPPEAQIMCVPFDPNEVSAEQLISMGLKTYIAENLIRFRNAGARFRKAEDLQRVYGIDSVMFSRLSPCISLNSQTIATPLSSITTLDINKSDIKDWKALPGIGEALASRIVKYRDGLGGFHSVSQVAETYGLSPETFALISEKLVISDTPKRINLNHATAEELSNHPYITQRQAEAIVNYRQNHGAFTATEDVLRIYALSEDWFARVQPYLSTATLSEGPSEIVVR